MTLDKNAERYANLLFSEAIERINRQGRTEAITRNFAQRDMLQSGGYVTAIAEAAVQRAAEIARARADSLLSACEKSGTLLDDQVISEIMSDVEQNCCQPKRIIENLRFTPANRMMDGDKHLEGAIRGQIERGSSRAISEVRRSLHIKKDGQMLDRQREQKEATTIAVQRQPAAIESREFPFVSDSRLRQIVERDYIEIQAAFAAGCWKSVIILSGGAIEAILLDILQRDPRAGTASRAPRKSDPSKWDFSDLIKVSVELGLVSLGVEKLSDPVREYRNLVHPGNEIRSGLKFGKEEATIALEVLHMVHRDLS